ncbi:MAG: class I SAM-dependent rRNA methyltransferase [Verrucomicrobiota bacterium]|nr:class I SAM-dependent rRNA methyltransferase [Verrucomicrobiota bacterium]
MKQNFNRGGRGNGYRPQGQPKPKTTAEALANAKPTVDTSGWEMPWIQLKTFSYHPCLYKPMLKAASPDARAGDWVHIYDKYGSYFGGGFYTPHARVPLRVLYQGSEPKGIEYIVELITRAIDLRHNALNLPAVSNAYRLINSDGDSLSGLIIDRYNDWLYVNIHSLGIAKNIGTWLPLIHEAVGTKHHHITVDPAIARMEWIDVNTLPSETPSAPIKIQEYGVRYYVDFEEGHKTGFFCDQRENRRLLASFAKGKSVLDLCCYTGGFAVTAKTFGGADDVAAVDLDENAIAMARKNGNLNQQTKIHWVHSDAFSYARQMIKNGDQWDIVICDPPKFVESRDDAYFGLKKYHDLNCLAINLVKPGGLFVTCSCSGLVPAEQFEQIIIRAAHNQNRRLQILNRTNAGADHPIYSNCRESLYLKVLWARVYPGGASPMGQAAAQVDPMTDVLLSTIPASPEENGENIDEGDEERNEVGPPF